MENKKVRIYRNPLPTIIFIITLGIVFLSGLIASCILFPEIIGITIPTILFFIGLYILMIVMGDFTPRYFSDKGFEYRGKSIDWAHVRITVIAVVRAGYFLVFDDKYLLGEDAIKQCRKGFCVQLRKKPLELITKYCQSRILVLDNKYEKEVLPRHSKKIDEIINNFNNKFNK